MKFENEGKQRIIEQAEEAGKYKRFVEHNAFLKELEKLNFLIGLEERERKNLI